MIKVLCINCKPDFSFLTSRGLLLDVTYETCDNIFPAIKSSTAINSQGQTIQLHSPDVFSYLDTNYKTSPYKVIFFGWYPKDYSADFNGTGGQTFKKKLSNGARFATTRQDGQNYEPHEFMHILGDILYTDLKKYDVNDQMDTTMVNGTLQRYYKNDRPNDPDSNFSVTWETYKKYLPELNNLGAMPTLKKGSKGEAVKELQTLLGITADGIFGSITKRVLVAFQLSKGLVGDGICGAKSWKALLETKKKYSVVITRTKDNGVQTIGELSAYNGKMFTCKTLELPWKDNQNNISCIPKGTYDVKYEKWNSKDKYGYKVQNVPNRDGIFIHEGNYHFNYEGCIGLGKDFYDLNKDGQIDITSTVATVKAFETFMDKKDFTLTIQ